MQALIQWKDVNNIAMRKLNNFNATPIVTSNYFKILAREKNRAKQDAKKQGSKPALREVFKKKQCKRTFFSKF